jgi:hypothetical protein
MPYRRAALLLVLVAAMLLPACGVAGFVRGSGTVVQTSLEVEAVDSIVIGSAFQVTLSLGEEPSLVLRTDDNLVNRIEVSTQNGELSLSLDGTATDATLEADLTVPAEALSSVELGGASSLTATDPITSPELRLSLNGASRAFVVVRSDRLEVQAEGASVVNASGSAQSLTADAMGASSLQLGELAVADADVRSAGASRVDVAVSEQLRASASGASTVRYTGDPEVVGRDVSGASTVEPG